jgi:peptidyl-prolyl cis-trans isomerase A (cyclophilin A)
MMAMSLLNQFRRLALPLGLLAAPALLATPAYAQKRSEAEIQARIDAEVAALEAEREKAAAAQAAAAPAPVPAPPPAPVVPAAPARIYKTVPVILTTTLGPISIAVEVERAPITAANFLRYVDEKRLDGTNFYRAFTFPDFPGVGLIQGGAQNDPKRILKPVQHEPTSKTGLSHVDGAVSLARNEINSGTADFFVILGDMKGLDAGSGQNGPDDQGFAVFGHVTEGMDLVRQISTAPRSPTKGEGVMKGQILEPAIRIITAKRASAP